MQSHLVDADHLHQRSQYMLHDVQEQNPSLFSVLRLVLCSLHGEEQPILVYNKAFEQGCISNLAKVFTIWEPELKAIASRLVDQMLVFKDWYYDPRFKGSYSIKKVLPVLCPELNYETLEISNGTQASLQYGKLLEATDEDNAQIRRAMLEYCKMDTLAMVRLFEALENTVASFV